MKSFQKGFVWLPTLLIILGIVVVGGGAYLYLQTRSVPASIDSIYAPVAPGTSSVSQAATPTAAIDKSSLNTTSDNPIITGTANGNSLDVEIAHLGEINGAFIFIKEVPITNGRWSFTADGDQSSIHSLADGSYMVIVRDELSGAVLATSTLTVKK